MPTRAPRGEATHPRGERDRLWGRSRIQAPVVVATDPGRPTRPLADDRSQAYDLVVAVAAGAIDDVGEIAAVLASFAGRPRD